MQLARGIFFLVVGVLFVAALLAVLAGVQPPPGQTLGPVNYIFGAVMAIASFAVGYLDVRNAMRKSRALGAKVLQDPEVIAFYQRSMEAWREGELDDVDAVYRKLGAASYDNFVAANAPLEGSALELFLQGGPREGEYLVSGSGPDMFNDWFVLTNQRLFQKDGINGEYKEVDLNTIRSCELKGTLSMTLSLELKSGERVVFDKLQLAPTQKALTKMADRA